MDTKSKSFKSFAEFWPFYLSQHQNKINRGLHLMGTAGGWAIGLFLIFKGSYFQGVLSGLAIGYSLAWIGHFVFEKNRPATFRYPIYSFVGDFKMCWLVFIRVLPF